MFIRSFIVILLLAGSVQETAAQAQRVEIRDHPDASTEVLWSTPAGLQGIFRSEGDLLFSSGDGIRSVHLDGTVVAGEFSASGARFGVLLKNAPDGPLQLRVFRRDGTLELTHELPHHRDDPRPRLALSDVSNEVVYVRPGTAEVCFLRDQESACVSLFKEAAYTLERNVVVDVSPDGRYVAVAAQREAAHPALSADDVNAYLFLFDRSGTLAWRRPLPQPAVQALAFSPSSLIVVSTYDAYGGPEIMQGSRLITVDGEMMGDAPHGADTFAFGDEEILLVTARRVAAFNVSEGASRLIYSVEPSRQLISAAAGEGKADTVLLTGRRIFTQGGFVFEGLRLLHVNEAGTLAGEDDVSVPPQRAPRVDVDVRARQTALILDRETHLYSWPR